MPTEFTPFSALAGGALIGLSATLLLWLIGRIAGVSGIVAGALQVGRNGLGWQHAFLAGLVAGAGLWFHLAPSVGFEVPSPREGFPIAWLLVAGVLVGLGTRLGSGCTSGHGICGLARFSPRSLVAVLVFMGVAIATLTLVRSFGS